MLNRVILFDSIFSLFYATVTLKGDPSQKGNITKLWCFSRTQSQHRNVSILHPSLLVTYKAVNFCFGTKVPPLTNPSTICSPCPPPSPIHSPSEPPCSSIGNWKFTEMSVYQFHCMLCIHNAWYLHFSGSYSSCAHISDWAFKTKSFVLSKFSLMPSPTYPYFVSELLVFYLWCQRTSETFWWC